MPEPETTARPSSTSPGSRLRETITPRRLAIAAATTFVVYVLAGYFVVPTIVESQLVEAIEAQTGTRPVVEAVSFDPFGWRLEVAGFALADPSGEGDAVAFDTLAIDASVLDLLIANLALEEVVLVAPRISAVIDERGRLNFLAFVPEPDPAAPEDAPAPAAEVEGDPEDSGLLVVDVDSIRIERGDVRFEDRSQRPAFDVAVAPLDLEVQGFTTRAGGTSPYSLDVRIGNETHLRWRGTLGLDPIHSEGELALERFDLRLPWDFLSDRLAFEIAEGELDAGARYVLDLSDGLSLAVHEARVGLRDVAVHDPALEEPVVKVPSFSVSGVEARVDAEGLASVDVAAIELDRARVRSHIAEDGEVHLARLFTPVEDATTESDAAEPSEEDATGSDADATPSRSPAIRVAMVALRELDIAIQDRSPARPVDLVIAPVDLTLTGYDSAPGTELGVELTSGVGEAGRLSIAGPLTLEPLTTRLAIAVEGLRLGVYQPYLDDVAKLDVPSASLSARLDVDYRDAGGAPAIAAKGRVQLDDLLTIDRRLEKAFVEWGSLRIEGIDYTSGHTSASAAGEPADRIRIGEIGLAGALAHVVVGADGGTNLDAIFGGEPGSTEDVPVEGADAPPSSGPGPLLEIAKIILDDVGADFYDLSQDPHFEISLDALTGTIEGLSTEDVARAKVSLDGRVDDVAPLRVAGQINPLSGDAYTDVMIRVDGVSMPAFTPYSGRFVGYSIDRGKLDLELEYKLNARHLEASNNVLLDQFEFGGRVESEDATSLPVGLAVAVMRDTEGNIEIPLPIEGDIDDPAFSVMGLLGKALVNVVTKVATSPFAAVAGLVGASGDDLAQVAFTAGSERISEVEGGELASLIPILVDRPALHLEIRGRADPEAEAAGLRREKIEGALRLAVYERASAREREAVGDPDAVVLSEDDRQAGLDRLARERLGMRARDLVPAERLPPRGPERDRVVAEAALASLAADVELAESDWRSLARSRAAAIQAALLASAKISPDRLFLVDVEVGPVAEQGAVSALLELTAD